MRTRFLLLIFPLILIPFIGLGQCFNSLVPDGLDCLSSKFLCGDVLHCYEGELGETMDDVGNQPDTPCGSQGSFENVEWISFIACESSVHINIEIWDCTDDYGLGKGIQVGIYEDCTFTNSIECYANPGEVPTEVELSGLNPGQIYYMFIDGYAGSRCKYRLKVREGIDTTQSIQPDPVSAPISASEETICAGSQVDLSVLVPQLNIGGNSCGIISENDQDYVFCVEWQVAGTPDDSAVMLDDAYDFVADQNALETQVVFYSPGTYTVDVEFEFNPVVFDGACTISEVVTVPVEILVQENTFEVLDAVTLCEGDSYEFCDSLYTETTLAQCHDPNDPCKIIAQQLTFTDKTEQELGNQYVCEGACFEFQGTQYCDPNIYEVDADDECLTYLFAVINLNYSVDYQGSYTLNCEDPIILLNPQFDINNQDPLEYVWYNESGDSIANTSTLQVTNAGTYSVVVSADDIAEGCEPTWSIVIGKNEDLPDLTFEIPALSCAMPNGQIIVNGGEQIQSAQWTGPNLNTSTLSPMVSDTGWYQLEVIANNGCDNTYPVYVSGDYEMPSVTPSFNDFDCNVTSSGLSYIANMDIINQVWQGPTFSSVSATDNTSESGAYLLVVTADNGCTNSAEFTIENNNESPQIELGEDLLWYCNTDSIILEVSTSQSISTNVMWNVIEGSPLTNIVDKQAQANSIGTYEVVVMNTDTGCESRDTISISENTDIPNSINVSTSEVSCHGGSDGGITVVSVEGGFADYSLTINGEDLVLGEQMSDLSPGIYNVVVTDSFGCTTDETVILSQPDSLMAELPEEISINVNTSQEIELIHNVAQDEIDNIVWLDANNEEVAQGQLIEWTATENNMLTAILTTVNGCTVQASVIINVIRLIEVYRPNVFSPNGDGINDFFLIKSNEEVMIKNLNIFDRWGNMVYEITDQMMSENGSDGWDGTFKGDKLNPGVFVYHITVLDAAGKEYVYYGDVTLVR